MKFEIHELALGRGEVQLAGRAQGDRVYDKVIAPTLGDLRPESVLLLSFKGVQFVTGSFFKATWLRLHPADAVAVPTMVAHLSEEVRTEFEIFLDGHRLPGLEALDWQRAGVMLATVHGGVEETSYTALRALTSRPGATAPELQGASNEGVSATAWTNRLNELHRQGLAFRQKAGRAWRFYSLAKEVRRG